MFISKKIPTLLFLTLAAAVAAFSPVRGGEKAEGGLKLLCTTFPIYQIARNVIAGSTGLTLDLMIPAALGCPHDYALNPSDMKKLEAADVLIVNGLGMEEFLGAPVKRANDRLILIDSSAGIDNLLDYGEEPDEDEEDEDEPDGGGEGGHEHHDGINPHIYVSPAMSARLAENIAAELALIDPAGANLYAENAKRYGQDMRGLAEEGVEIGGRLANNRMVEPHGVFDYLARDMGLRIVGVMQPHGGELSAAGMLKLVEIIRREKPAALFVEPQYQGKTGQTLSRETGIPLFTLDPAANGPENAPMDYYETVMRKNLTVIADAMGGK